MKEISRSLDNIVRDAYPRLKVIHERDASDKPYPDKWSLKELLGHLIDSAATNHQRFVRMQEQSNIGTLRYSQNHWVSSQQYQQEAWADIIEMWYRYNLHLVHVIAHVNPATLGNLCDVGDPQPTTLKVIIEDYLRHVEHHLGQLFSGADPRERRKWV